MVRILRGRAPRGVPLARGEGADTRLRPTNRVLPPGGRAPPKRAAVMRVALRTGPGVSESIKTYVVRKAKRMGTQNTGAPR